MLSLINEKISPLRFRVIVLSILFLCSSYVHAELEVFTPQHIAKIRGVSSCVISPDGKYIAFGLSVPRGLNQDDSGSSYAELHVVDMEGRTRGYVTGKVNVSGIQWTPDGKNISFLAKRGDDKHKSLYIIPIDGGEARNILSHETSISLYTWNADNKHVVFKAKDKLSKEKKKRKDIVTALRKKLAIKNNNDRALVAYCIIAPMVRENKVNEVKKMLDIIHKESPLLAFHAEKMARAAAEHYSTCDSGPVNRRPLAADVRKHFSKYMPQRFSPKRSRFYEWVYKQSPALRQAVPNGFSLEKGLMAGPERFLWAHPHLFKAAFSDQ